jgi:2-polyprenyl-6-methoxyphenol hydroxylase-like FAD-dependent oxidoreductase
MVDAVVLGRCLAGASSLEEALQAYNDDTVRRGRELYRASRRSASSFAPSGTAVVAPAELLLRLEK